MRCLAMRLKKIFGKLAGGKENKQSPQLLHSNKKKEKKMKRYLNTKSKQGWGKNCTYLIVCWLVPSEKEISSLLKS